MVVKIEGKYDEGEIVTLTQINTDYTHKIAQKMSITPEDVVNRILYILMSDATGIREEINDFCEVRLKSKRRTVEEVMLPYRAKHLQQIENYNTLKEIMECLDA